MPNISPEVRTYIYRVGLAVIAIAVFYNLIDANAAVLWGGLLAALIPTGIANIFAPTQRRQEEQAEAVIEKIKTGEIVAPGVDVVDPYGAPEIVDAPIDYNSEHGENPELIDEGDER